jgi:hypothetical protein
MNLTRASTLFKIARNIRHHALRMSIYGTRR